MGSCREPVHHSRDITVPSGAYLIINAGTVVQFASTDGQAGGLDTARVELTVKGSLTVNGTTASPVVFQGQSGTTAGTWYGIVADAAAAMVSIGGADIRHTSYGISSAAPGNVVSVTSSSIQTTNYGLNITGGAPTFSDVSISSAGTGAYFTDNAAGGTLSNTIIRNCTNYGVYVYTNTATNPTLNIVNSTLNANGSYGVYAQATSGLSTAVTIKNSNITNHSTGIYRYTGSGNPSVTVTYSNVWKNSTNYSNVVGGVGTFSSNPLRQHHQPAPPVQLALALRQRRQHRHRRSPLHR